MKIELKNIKVAAHLSEETTAFTADLYINNVKAAYCKNDGQGGCTFYNPYSLEHRALITEAEAYCLTLPPVETNLSDPSDKSKKFVIKMDLENFIDDLLEKHLADKDKQKFERQKERDMKKSILVGDDTSYVAFNFSKSVDEVLCSTNPVQSINTMLQAVVSKIKPGQRILNTNFPAGVIIPEIVNA